MLPEFNDGIEEADFGVNFLITKIAQNHIFHSPNIHTNE